MIFRIKDNKDCVCVSNKILSVIGPILDKDGIIINHDTEKA